MSRRTGSSSAAAKPKAATKIKPVKKFAPRTMQTRINNAKVNPLDLEGPSSDEDRAPKPPGPKRKRKTPQEKAAIEEKRSDALAKVGELEEDIAQQVNLEAGTPRTISRKASYECPDPSPVAAKSKRMPVSSRVDIFSEDDDFKELPPAKKRRPLKEQLDRIKAAQAAKRSADKDLATVRVRFDTQLEH